VQLHPAVEFMRQRKHQMKIVYRDDALSLLLTPLLGCLLLALWTMAVATRMIARLRKATLFALHEVSAERLGAAGAKGAHDFMLLRIQGAVLPIRGQELIQDRLHPAEHAHTSPPDNKSTPVPCGNVGLQCT